jgi:hypothetical protein
MALAVDHTANPIATFGSAAAIHFLPNSHFALLAAYFAASHASGTTKGTVGVSIQTLRIAWIRHNRIRLHEPPQLGIVVARLVVVQPDVRLFPLTGEMEVGLVDGHRVG